MLNMEKNRILNWLFIFFWVGMVVMIAATPVYLMKVTDLLIAMIGLMFSNYIMYNYCMDMLLLKYGTKTNTSSKTNR